MTRTTGWTLMSVFVFGLGVLAAAPARACWQCDGIGCVTTEGGARACFYGVHGCTTLGACGDGSGGGPERFASDDGVALQLTWIESEGPAAGPRVLRGAGRRVFGAAALRAFRAAAEQPAEDAAVVAAVAGFGEAFEVALAGGAGDGVALAWTAEGRGGRVAVRALRAGVAGESIAAERLAENDVLVVPVRHDGRACALVIQPRVLPRLSVRLETAELVRTARDAVRPGRARLDIRVAAGN